MEFSGLTSDGATKFQELRAMNKAARAKESRLKVEKDFLDKYRGKLGLKCASAEAEKRMKRRAKATKTVETVTFSEDILDLD